jgi:hypothetical protein
MDDEAAVQVAGHILGTPDSSQASPLEGIESDRGDSSGPFDEGDDSPLMK